MLFHFPDSASVSYDLTGFKGSHDFLMVRAGKADIVRAKSLRHVSVRGTDTFFFQSGRGLNYSMLKLVT